MTQKPKSGFALLSILVLAVLAIGIATSVYLVQTKQIFQNKAAGSRPNVLVFMVDDLDEGSFNQLLAANKLPNIKKYLLDKGVRFTNSFVTESICCSSRASFLTGKYSHNSGVWQVFGTEAGMRGLATKGLIGDWFPTWLQNNGYYTGHVGKFMNTYEYGPGKKPGFNYWRNITGYDNRPGMYYVWADTNPTPFNPDSYQIKYINDKANEFLNNFSNQQAGNFFLELTPHSPHVFVYSWREEFMAGRNGWKSR